MKGKVLHISKSKYLNLAEVQQQEVIHVDRTTGKRVLKHNTPFNFRELQKFFTL